MLKIFKRLPPLKTAGAILFLFVQIASTLLSRLFRCFAFMGKGFSALVGITFLSG
ncbi:MAG: hypothetical protein P4L49_10385 [Desulfosporosinus sp.]|nr:hypothetical protein [Desulfosporosinus sp.]